MHSIPFRSNCFFNKTLHDLSPYINTFNLGIKHIPIPKDVTNDEIQKAYSNFANRTLWQYHFHRQNLFATLDMSIEDDDNINTYEPNLRVKKDLIKPCHLIKEDHPLRVQLRDFHNFLEDYIQNHTTTHKTCNTLKSIKNIQNKFPDIVFKPTDKNLGLCALTVDDYDSMVMLHLNNEINYKLAANTGPASRILLKQLISDFEDFRDNTIWYLKEKPCIRFEYDFRWPKFYCLPKLHKQGTIKGRPIAGQVNWITTPVSRILNHRLQSELHQFPCILPNSFSLVKDLETFNTTEHTTNMNIYIITGDIESLYPNMNLDTLYSIIDKIDITCVDLTKFICRNSYVMYNDLIYHQTHGIPMGTNAAVTLANMYVGFLIDNYINSRGQTLWYKRYIDDIFILWTGSLEQWDRCKSNIQALLKIPIHWDNPSTTQGIFLDLHITRCAYNGQFITSIHQKPLSKFHYITPLSSHAPHMFTGFIKGELTRYARLSSTPFAYNHTKQLFYQRLIQRGYPRKLLNRCFKKHNWQMRFNEDDSLTCTILPFVLPYTLRNNCRLIQRQIQLITEDITSWFAYAKIVFAHSKRPNIYDYLCPSSLTKNHKDILRSRNNR